MQRETYIGPWLPEPVFTETNEQFAPEQQANLHDSLSIAFLTLLEELTPLERAVFLLRMVFDYEYSEIARILDRKETACRQLCNRAKRHIADHRPRFRASKETHRQILNKFIQATSTGDLDGLMQLLSEDVMFWSDGGGKVRGAAINPLCGRKPVARFVLAAARRQGNERVNLAEVNNEPAVLISIEGQLIGVISITVDNERVCEIHAIGNPDKLEWMSRNVAERKTTSQ
jgi:RNA polymerase sigma-70 factor (ECF subfamily)